MQTLERNGLSDEQVRELITDPSIAPTCGVDLIASDGTVTDLSDDVDGCVVSWAGYADVHRSVKLQVSRRLDWPAVEVRPWQQFGAARFHLGVFGLETPQNAAASGVFDIDGYDRLRPLTRKIGDTYNVASGASYLTAIAAIVTASGSSASVQLDSAQAAAVLPGPAVWAFNPDDLASYLRAINDLLAAINYRGVWADPDGTLVSVPYRPPSERGTEWTFDLTDTATDLVDPDPTAMEDNFAKPTAWRFVRNGMATQPVEDSGLYTVGDWDAADAVRAAYAFDAADQASLVAQADQQVIVDTSRTRLVDITTDPLPCLDHFDIVRFVAPKLALDTRCQIRQWDQDIIAATTRIQMEVVDA